MFSSISLGQSRIGFWVDAPVWSLSHCIWWRNHDVSKERVWHGACCQRCSSGRQLPLTRTAPPATWKYFRKKNFFGKNYIKVNSVAWLWHITIMISAKILRGFKGWTKIPVHYCSLLIIVIEYLQFVCYRAKNSNDKQWAIARLSKSIFTTMYFEIIFMVLIQFICRKRCNKSQHVWVLRGGPPKGESPIVTPIVLLVMSLYWVMKCKG